MVALHGRGQLLTFRFVPAQLRKAHHREASPVGMAELVDHTYGFGLAHTGPLFEPVAAKESRLSLHLAHVQAAHQSGALRRESVKGDYGVQALLDPG